MLKRHFFLLATVLIAQATIAQAQHKSENNLRKLNYAEQVITNLYVDEVDETKLVEDAIRGMLEKLDPHSSYTNPQETKQMTEPLNGSFVIGNVVSR